MFVFGNRFFVSHFFHRLIHFSKTVKSLQNLFLISNFWLATKVGLQIVFHTFTVTRKMCLKRELRMRIELS